MDPHRFEGIGMTSRRTRERLVARLADEGIRDQRVLQAILDVPRHLFVDEALASRAYDNTPLPIGHGQTISQPWVVARMTELLIERDIPERVLELGTGSGYQAAILAYLGVEVYTVERIKVLADRARQRMRELKLYRVHVRYGDGSEGWAQHAPYQGIIVTAAPEEVPEALWDQLDEGGRLVAPIGGAGQPQELVLVERENGELKRRHVASVSFVPLLGGCR
ncbi:protein-L-isoaspartate(D-aspartate) O-methyltransferase [Alkalispirillum mobile]|uniref:Protein-L-isoaspartate O-methyltransferase n=1 Tax=Alkalispirillum mobile TaxID=85925 RepID=A0A498CEE9_9GAMM|nr:protein-L-isoaspartate(D-aspartate) O-methyltransferase [Alkalispirillum mobile]RLK50691.1 protein-L-isoaspartate(D-aspartate) O-methyltransferase [Alkalispirillum mobile]